MYDGQSAGSWSIYPSDHPLANPDLDDIYEYDVDEASRRYRASGDPLAEGMVETLVEPPTRAEAIEHAERLEFSG